MLYKQAGLVTMRLAMSGFLIIITACIAACTTEKPEGSGSYLLPWADRNGEFHLQEILISTLGSSSEVSGPAAQVYVAPIFNEKGLSGPVARPRISVSNGIKIPLDVQSSMALAAYANFERIQAFERTVLGKTTIRWPRQVAIELELIDMNSGQVDQHNARYFGNQDIIAIFPDSGRRLPMAVNSAILSHEHFHAHFHKAVMALVSPPRAQNKELSRMDFSKPDDYNLLVLRAWNEGLADFYAAVYTQAPDMLSASIGNLEGRNARNVDAEFSGFMSVEQYKVQLARGQRGNLEGSEAWCQSLNCAYRQGTQLARWLYEYAGPTSLKNQKYVLAKTVANLAELAAVSKSALGARFMELSEAAEILVKGTALTTERCQLLQEVMSASSFQERFGECSNL